MQLVGLYFAAVLYYFAIGPPFFQTTERLFLKSIEVRS